MKIFLSSQEEKKPSLEEIAKQFDMQYAQMAMELERTKSTIKRLNKMDSRLRDIENTISTEGLAVKSTTISSKMKDGIKLILMKQNAITSDQLSRIMQMSRTRCNEYLKGMETDGILESNTKCRKKYYKLRQEK
jgi:response regulator of citrate/malate metabolism